MSKKLFTPQEIEQLKQNEYVKSVSEKGITYTKEFKENFITMSEKGKFPREIFDYYRLNVKRLGMQYLNPSAKIKIFITTSSTWINRYLSNFIFYLI